MIIITINFALLPLFFSLPTIIIIIITATTISQLLYYYFIIILLLSLSSTDYHRHLVYDHRLRSPTSLSMSMLTIHTRTYTHTQYTCCKLVIALTEGRRPKTTEKPESSALDRSPLLGEPVVPAQACARRVKELTCPMVKENAFCAYDTRLSRTAVGPCSNGHAPIAIYPAVNMCYDTCIIIVKKKKKGKNESMLRSHFARKSPDRC